MTQITTGPAATKAQANPALCKKLHRGATKQELADAHQTKMAAKAKRRAEQHLAMQGQRYVLAASLNRRTGKPHEHKREIARRLGRGEG